MKKLLHAILLLTLVSATAYGQASLSFSGGSGAHFTFTLAQPVTYTITTAGNGPIFVFQSAGNPFSAGSGTIVPSSINYKINGGAPQPFGTVASGTTFGSVTPNDIYLYGAFPALNLGDVITLQAGTFTTTNNIANAAPAGGSFNTFIAESAGFTRISPNGIAIPEPQPILLVALGGLGLFGWQVLRRKKAA